jgi:hypothetical protein
MGSKSRRWTSTSWRASGTGRSASCSRGSTCCPARPRWRTWSCRCSTPTGRIAGSARSRRWRSTVDPRRGPGQPARPQAERALRWAAAARRHRARRWSTVDLAAEPRLILADEPTGNLSSRQSEEIMQIFQELNEEGITIVMVTHEPDIGQHTRRIVQIRDGRVVEDERLRERLLATDVLASLGHEARGTARCARARSGSTAGRLANSPLRASCSVLRAGAQRP